ncbi:hypothetical protein [Aliiroseovarius sp. F20344]|uniref:hypothetical protein n=1 Tax=Aliiroseovarius sp. F20344 TaxID=2926414 RepID=UPI001FF68017|nr:hypothetical protein [Aliiroseovarius sp. F20344]MCK0143394.1 hypothetical protein [Aliiroseovarius sp. F20344]
MPNPVTTTRRIFAALSQVVRHSTLDSAGRGLGARGIAHLLLYRQIKPVLHLQALGFTNFLLPQKKTAPEKAPFP